MEEFFNNYYLQLSQLHQLTRFIGFDDSKEDVKNYLSEIGIQSEKFGNGVWGISYRNIRKYFRALIGDARNGANVIAISNRKGGIGKTTTTINLAHTLHLLGYRILVIDGDHQMNLTNHYIDVDEDFEEYENTVYDFYQGSCTLGNSRQHVYEGYDVIPSHKNLDDVKSEYSRFKSKHHQLNQEIIDLRGDYDFILIDCSPGSDKGVKHIFSICDLVLVPTEIDFDSRDGVIKLYEELSTEFDRGMLKKHPSELLRVNFNKESARLTNSEKQIKEQIMDELELLMFKGEDMSIKKNSRIHMARNQRVPVWGKTDGKFSDETLRRIFRLSIHVAYHLRQETNQEDIYQGGEI